MFYYEFYQHVNIIKCICLKVVVVAAVAVLFEKYFSMTISLGGVVVILAWCRMLTGEMGRGGGCGGDIHYIYMWS